MCRLSRPPSSTEEVSNYTVAKAISIRRPQPPHGEFDLAARHLSPRFDFGHVGSLGVLGQERPRRLPGLVSWQGEGLPRIAVISLAGEALGRPSDQLGLSVFGKASKYSLLAMLINLGVAIEGEWPLCPCRELHRGLARNIAAARAA